MKYSSLASAALLLAVCASTAVAEWQPGLRYGILPFNNNADFKPAENLTEWEVVQYPIDADTKSHWPTAKGGNGVAVYQGQIYLEAGIYWFAESADTGTRLAIGGTEVLKDTGWSNPALKRFVVETTGWYDFDLRFLDDGGGYGPTKADWWTRSDLAFGWKQGDEGDDSSVAANKVPDAYSVPENPDGATIGNCLFRYDDALGFADELLIKQSPFAIPVTVEPTGTISGLEADDAVPCSSATEYTAESGDMRAVLSGYVISNRVNNIWALRETKTDGTSDVTYTHDGYANTLFWTWNVQYKLTTSASSGGTVDVATGWYDRDSQVTLTASHPSASFVCWVGDVADADQTKNPLTVTMEQARTLRAEFGASEFFVDPVNGNDANPGSASLPFKTLAKATALASDGFTINLAPGTYSVSAETVINDAVTLKGTGAKPTDVIIKGTQSSSLRVITLNNRDARLENLTVSHGNTYGTNSSNRKNGANVFIDANGGTVTNCVLTQAKLQYHTIGGVYLNSADALVTHCVITNNYMSDGNGEGGTAVGMAAGRVEYCLIADNFDSPAISPNRNCLSAVYITGGVMEHCTVVDNMPCGCAIYLSGGEVRKCVFANNHNIYWPQTEQIRTSTAALKNTAFTDCVWDQGDISETCPQGTVKFADYANGDYRLASDSAGIVQGGHDWGCYETDESTTVVAPEPPASVTVTAGEDIKAAVRRVREGGEVILGAGTHPVVYRPVMLTKAVTLRGAGSDPSAVLITKGNDALLGSVVFLSNADALLTGLTVGDYSNNNGPNQCALGVTTVQDGGSVSNCVLRKMSLVTSGHSGTALRIRKPGAHVTRCVISNITTHANTSYGGAVALEAAGSIIDNCLLIDCNNDTWNSPTSSHWAKDTPGAIYQSDGTIANCTIVNCKAPRVAVAKCSGGVLRDSVIYGNLRYNTSYPETEIIGTGAGTSNWVNVVSDIRKVNDNCVLATADTIGFVDYANGDFRITGNSIARNLCGRELTTGESAVDLDGNPRRFGSRIDAGCYECQQSSAFLFMIK